MVCVQTQECSLIVERQPVEDLLSFVNAVQQSKLLNAHYTEVLTVGKVETPGGCLVASGFADCEINGVRFFGMGGGSIGMNADLEVCPGTGYVVAVLANMDPNSAGQESMFI